MTQMKNEKATAGRERQHETQRTAAAAATAAAAKAESSPSRSRARGKSLYMDRVENAKARVEHSKMSGSQSQSFPVDADNDQAAAVMQSFSVPCPELPNPDEECDFVVEGCTNQMKCNTRYSKSNEMYQGFWIWDAPEGVDRALSFNGSGDWVISTKSLARESTEDKKAKLFVTVPRATGPADLDVLEWQEDQSVFGLQPEYKYAPAIRILPVDTNTKTALFAPLPGLPNEGEDSSGGEYPDLSDNSSEEDGDELSVADVFDFLDSMVSSRRTSLLDLFREVDEDLSGELGYGRARRRSRRGPLLRFL
jgi:hypothetical protein